MESKIAFGYDLLFMMRTLELTAGGKVNPAADAATQFFLITWGFTIEELDEVNKAFRADVEKKQMPDLQQVIERLSNHVKKDTLAMERMLTNAIAVAYIDAEITDDEVSFIRMLSSSFDLRPSELEGHLKTGIQLAMGLNFFGTVYNEAKK